MTPLQRTLADYRTTGLTAGPQVMAYLREELRKNGVLSARELKRARHGRWVKIAGLVIVRQRPGTAKGFCFLTLEDETGTSNAVVVPDMFQRHRTVIHTASLLQVEGPVQIVDDVIHVRARKFVELALPQIEVKQRGHGYRMRVAPEEGGGKEAGRVAEAASPADGPPSSPALPKSHDFR